ncbi:MAG: ABC transporter ATP-binding protein, partial [Jatrophihabitans endophyticus]|nr:ABC transporter ATP-binding protein [Jatrophihabitans endophyticus]
MIDVQRVWKRFHADRSRPTLKDQLQRVRRPRADRDSRWRWVLRDIDFRVEAGEAVGIVGSNG